MLRNYLKGYVLFVSLMGAGWFGLAAPAVIAQPSILVSPDSIDFGDVDVKFSEQRAVSITNTGSTVMSATARLALGVHFRIDQGFGRLTLQPGQQVNVLVSFAPIRPGITSDTLFIDHDASNLPSPQFVEFFGRGIPRPEAEVTPSEIDFGEVSLGVPDTATILIMNPGSGFLSTKTFISSETGDFRLLTTSETVQVFAGDTATAVVEFTPSASGPASAQVEVRHNGRNTPEPLLVDVTATGGREVTSSDTDGVPAVDFEIGANYPNPFSDATTVPFVLSEASNIRVTVFDQTGKTVAVLADGYHAAGRHEVDFDPTLLASGVYMVSIEAGGRSTARRMVLSR